MNHKKSRSKSSNMIYDLDNLSIDLSGGFDLNMKNLLNLKNNFEYSNDSKIS